MRGAMLRWGLLAMAAALAPASAMASEEGYAHYQIGDRAAPTPGRPEAALLLSGGGPWNLDAFRWFVAKAGHGHIVVLRASLGPEIGEAFYNNVGGVASVETFVFDDRKAAFDPRVIAALSKADGVFIAGGDQSRYVRFWKGTPVAATLDRLAKDRPIGGTSAGLAILGGHTYGATDGGSILSDTALRDPLGPAVTMVDDFLHMPRMGKILTDSHFTIRNRMGRLIAFLANIRHRGSSQVVGLGIDEGASICVDGRGIGRLMSSPGGYAWLLRPVGPPQTARLSTPLDYAAVKIMILGKDSRIDLGTLTISNPAAAGTARVAGGQLTGVPRPAGAH